VERRGAGDPVRRPRPPGFHKKAPTVAPPYPRRGDFMRLQERLDPPGAFRNQGLQSHVLGNA
jgi:hypothetical protein